MIIAPLIVERTKAGGEWAKIRGVVMVPKPTLSKQQIEHAKKLLAGQEHISIVAESSGFICVSDQR
ncbi:hypothetical protein ABF87_09045 [Nitrosomonas sp. JL21]|nr:hypothetical protein [Nitrosomonas sp. JL21]